MDALYFRVSSDRQTTENQFADLLQIAEQDGSGRDWAEIRRLLANVVYVEERPTHAGGVRVVYKVRPEVVAELTPHCIYVEQGRSGRAGAKRRPLFERMKRDASTRKLDRLLVWKVSRLGRDMREVISTVYELADLGVTVVPIKSQTGPVTSSMGKLLWAIQAWYAEMENDERLDSIRAGQKRARAAGKHIGRPRRIFDRVEIVRLRDQEHLSWPKIAARLGLGLGTVVRAYWGLTGVPSPRVIV
jgi:putative DNA-invertase from lambdoid prophage Rac